MSKQFQNVPDYLPRLLSGAKLSVLVALCAVMIAVALGLGGALMKVSRSGFARRTAGAYSSVVRGVPELVWILLFFFGFQLTLNSLTKSLGWNPIIISPFWAGAITLGLIYGAYFTETFRGAILAIPPGQIEAARAFGLTGPQVFRRVTFPQLMRFALPGVRNNWLVLIKSTALISVVGLDDLTRIAQQGGSSTHSQFAFNITSAAFFLMITTASLFVMKQLERRYSLGSDATARA